MVETGTQSGRRKVIVRINPRCPPRDLGLQSGLILGPNLTGCKTVNPSASSNVIAVPEFSAKVMAAWVTWVFQSESRAVKTD